jgi:hypothetical protein
MEPEYQTDAALDSALTEYGQAEPRPGLEGRVLANLRDKDERSLVRSQFWPAVFAVAALLVAAGATFLVRREGETRRDVAANRVGMVAQAHASRPEATPGTAAVVPERQQRQPAPRKSLAQLHETAEPKLETFPSPPSFSDQDKLLRIYLRETPREEVLRTASRAKSLDDLQVEDLSIAPLDVQDTVLTTQRVGN